VRRVPNAGVGFAVQRLDTHLAHQRSHVFAAGPVPGEPEHLTQLTGCRTTDSPDANG